MLVCAERFVTQARQTYDQVSIKAGTGKKPDETGCDSAVSNALSSYMLDDVREQAWPARLTLSLTLSSLN